MNHSNLSGLLVAIAITVISCSNLLGQRVEAGEESRQTIGLVLSGGGAKGIAHVGVIKALEDNDIPIDYVTGTSMGAIVGSLYSCGWSPAKMIEFFTAPDFLDWSSGTINPAHTFYVESSHQTPEWFSLNADINKNGGNNILPTNLISPLPMNVEFLKLYVPYTAQCGENFNNLFVPFRCVTSDVYNKHKIVLSKGSLGDAVRASMSFPLVFKPIKMDGVLVYDGGIYDNFPVDVMQEDFNPDFIIGVSVSGPDKKPQEGNVYSQLEDMIIQNNNYSVPSKNGIKIQVPVLNFGVLDFAKAETIYQIGYKTGMEMVDSIKKRISAREPLQNVNERRNRFARNTPDVKFDKVEVTGLSDPGQVRFMQYLFSRGKHEQIDMTQVENSYYEAVTDGTLTDLLPQAILGNNNKNNTLLLEATPKKPWSLGFGGWITSSANSMLYLGLGYHKLGYNALDVKLGAWIGQSYMAGMLSARFNIRSSVPSYFRFEGVLSKQKFYESQLLFFEKSSPSFITECDNFIRIGYERAVGHRMKFYANMAYGYMSDSYYPTNITDYAQTGKDKMQYHIGAIKCGMAANSLNENMYPSEGEKWFTDVLFSYESSRFTPQGDKSLRTSYHGRPRASVEGYWTKYFKLGKCMSLGAMANALATFQHLQYDYTSTVIHSPAFTPTPSTQSLFNEAFRSDNYLAAGVIPIWSPVKRLQLRGDFYVYSPIRHLEKYGDGIRYNGWFKKVRFIGEVAAVYNFPFASLSVYCNYLSYPSKNWNVGINFGLFFKAPKLLR